MSPNSEVLADEIQTDYKPLVEPQAAPREYEYVYGNIIAFVYWHLAAFYGLYLCFTSAKLETLVFNYILYVMAEIGVTAGAHRLWSHRSYKAKTPLQVILVIFHCIAAQKHVIDFVRNHKVHHKYSDTDADPHNASRGFFFSHYGWMMVKKHPKVIEAGERNDLSDVYNNRLLAFQKKYTMPLNTLFAFILPTLVPMVFWAESLNNAYHVNMLRFIANLCTICFVNSAAHMWGNKPYDKNILPVQSSIVSFFTCGEGYHNYHHTFPIDYRAAELGNYKLNLNTLFIDFFAWIGWAYDLKTVSQDVVLKRMARTGDGSTTAVSSLHSVSK